MSEVDLKASLSFGVGVVRFIIRSPLIIGVFVCVVVGVFCVARVNGGVESGDGGTVVSFGDVFVSNIGLLLRSALGGADAEDMPL